MAPNIGVNLRVTGHCNQGDRRYMEDVFSVAYQQTEDEKDLEYAFFGIFDGHGGREAAQFAKENLMDLVVSQKNFWSDDDDLVLKAIREGFIATHQAMWKELERWPRTSAGLPSTSGSTASVAFIRRGKIYIGHVGDSAIILGYQRPDDDGRWHARSLTRDHKPESTEECTRIKLCGGKVINKSGVSRVVWNRPRIGHQGPIRRSTEIDEIPFLAVARSLGDLWSFNSSNNEYVVSPEPDLHVLPIDVTSHRCLVLGTDGMWNMVSPQWAIDNVAQSELFNEEWLVTHTNTGQERQWINPSKRLVDLALSKWKIKFLRADNTSVVTVMLDPPGPPKVQMMRKRLRQCSSSETSAAPCPADCSQPAKRRAVLEPAPDVASARFRPALFRSSQDGRVPPPPSVSVRSPATVVPPLQRDYKVFNPVVSTLSRSDVHEMSSSPTIAAPPLTTTEPSIPAAADSDVENRAASPTSLLQRYRCRRSAPVRRRSSKAQDLISQQLLRLRSSLLTPPRTRRSALLHRRALRSHNGDSMVLPPLSCRNAR